MWEIRQIQLVIKEFLRVYQWKRKYWELAYVGLNSQCLIKFRDKKIYKNDFYLMSINHNWNIVTII